METTRDHPVQILIEVLLLEVLTQEEVLVQLEVQAQEEVLAHPPPHDQLVTGEEVINKNIFNL